MNISRGYSRTLSSNQLGTVLISLVIENAHLTSDMFTQA